MAYNGIYSAPYPIYGQPSYQPSMPQNQGNNGMIWVQGESGAKSYLTAPNTTVVLFDSEAQTIYLKSADATGLPSMRILDYSIRDQKPNNGVFAKQSEDFATRKEMDALRAEIADIRAHMKGVAHESTVRTDE